LLAVLNNLILCLQSNPLKQLQLRGHDDAITAFAMSPNGALLASGQKGQNSDVIIWNTQTLTQQFRFQVCKPA
jgi:WD40 repeat protein